MARTISLKHTIWNDGIRTVYFYDGELQAKDGIVKVPSDRPEWIRRAWVLGYRLDPRSGDEITSLEDLVPTEVMSAESEGQDEDTSSRRRTAS